MVPSPQQAGPWTAPIFTSIRCVIPRFTYEAPAASARIWRRAQCVRGCSAGPRLSVIAEEPSHEPACTQTDGATGQPLAVRGGRELGSNPSEDQNASSIHSNPYRVATEMARKVPKPTIQSTGRPLGMQSSHDDYIGSPLYRGVLMMTVLGAIGRDPGTGLPASDGESGAGGRPTADDRPRIAAIVALQRGSYHRERRVSRDGAVTAARAIVESR